MFTFLKTPGPDPEWALAGGGGQTLNGGRTRATGSRSRTPVGVQGHSPLEALEF